MSIRYHDKIVFNWHPRKLFKNRCNMADMDEFSCVGRLENRMVNNVFSIEGRRSGIKAGVHVNLSEILVSLKRG